MKIHIDINRKESVSCQEVLPEAEIIIKGYGTLQECNRLSSIISEAYKNNKDLFTSAKGLTKKNEAVLQLSTAMNTLYHAILEHFPSTTEFNKNLLEQYHIIESYLK